jgi:hypothetical protein
MSSSLALLADVTISTVRVGGGTPGGGVEPITYIGFASAGAWLNRSTVSAGGGIRDDSVRHEDGGIETHVEDSVGKQGALTTLDDIADSDVEKDDSRV